MTLKQELLHFIKLQQTTGKNKVFQWDAEGMSQYIDWAFANNYLFTVFDKFGLSGVVVAYPVHKYNIIEDILPKNDLDDSNTVCPIAIMDAIFWTEEARIDLTHKLMTRFENWNNRDKVSLRYGKIKHLPNRYFELTGGKL